MNSAPTTTHRTVALVGAAGSGKTTLAEALLLRAGAIPSAGSVEQGNTVCDHEPEEIARGMSLGLSLAPAAQWTDPDGVEYTITLADTPGHPDFVGGVDTALSVADVAVVAVSAVDGVTAGTRFAWARRRGGRRAAHRRRDAGGQGPRGLPPRAGRAAGGVRRPARGRSSCRSVRSRRSTGVADVLSEQALEYDEDGRHHDEPMPRRGRGRGAPACTST